MTTAHQARFRIEHPNSRPRATRIIALDQASAQALRALIEAVTDGARFLIAPDAEGRSDGTLLAGDESKVPMAEALSGADAVVMVASARENAEAALRIGPECVVRGIMTTGVILAAPGDEADCSVALRNLRRYTAMLVVATDVEYLAEMLRALRA
jgi:hypothetical protein